MKPCKTFDKVQRKTELRFLVFQRDNYLCVNCGDVAHEAHHVVPLIKGGKDHAKNMASLCQSCHKLVHGIGSTSLSGLIRLGKNSDNSSKKRRVATGNSSYRRKRRIMYSKNLRDTIKSWGLKDCFPSGSLIEADRNGLRDRLRLGWLLLCPDALATIPQHDWLATERLDPEHSRPFAPDRVRVTLAQKVAALQALGVPALLERFGRGEVIAATDPAVLALHATATTYRDAVIKVLGSLFLKSKMASPGKLPSGTLRNLLRAVGWELKSAGRIRARTEGNRGVCIYSAAPLALPEGVVLQDLENVFRKELRPKANQLTEQHNEQACA